MASVLATLPAMLSACGRDAAAGPDGGRISVVASFYPLAAAVTEVGGEHVDVTNLTPPGVEPHDLELAPDDVEAIATADVVVYLGSGFQPAVQDALGDAEGTQVDALKAVQTLPPPEGGEPGVTLDPHVWLDPIRYEEIVRRVQQVLTTKDRADASTFRRNADAFVARLETLDGEFRATLDGCARHTIVTSHAAFGYVADRYGLTQVSISGLSPDAEPDPAHLADLRDLVDREGLTTIFTETLVSPKVAETLAREAGVTTATLDPLEGLTDEEVAAGDDYLSVMRANLRTLASALDCG